jgi:hypothetical protein
LAPSCQATFSLPPTSSASTLSSPNPSAAALQLQDPPCTCPTRTNSRPTPGLRLKRNASPPSFFSFTPQIPSQPNLFSSNQLLSTKSSEPFRLIKLTTSFPSNQLPSTRCFPSHHQPLTASRSTAVVISGTLAAACSEPPSEHLAERTSGCFAGFSGHPADQLHSEVRSDQPERDPRPPGPSRIGTLPIPAVSSRRASDGLARFMKGPRRLGPRRGSTIAGRWARRRATGI